VIDDENLDNCATRASEALLNFQKQEKECADGDKDESEEEDDEDEKKRMKRLGDLIGASASLCVAIRRLVDLQVQLDVDATTHNLTCAWEAAAKVTHNEIDGRMLDLTNTDQLEEAFPETSNTGNWIRSWHLGSGSFGSAALYVQYSEAGDITNRVVVKDCDYNQTTQKKRMFDEDDSLWTQDRNRARIPMEVATMYDLREKPGSRYVVKILNWRMGPDGRRLFRLYLEVSSSIGQSMRNY
jgi:hypothetical protein